MSSKHVDVFISSTSTDLEKYREIAIHVCNRLGLFPIAMEEFPPDPRGAVDYCKAKVEEAEAYLGIYAYRYGWQPFGEKSITEMEYEWAVERGLPVYIFVVDEDIPWPPKLIDKGDAGTRMDAFKKHVMGKHIVKKFTDDFDKFKDDMFVALGALRDAHKPEPGADIHYVSDIPAPPEPYIAHPYTLMHATRLFGRNDELNLLTDWVARPASRVYQARILNVVAIGGMGKSAVTWKWFNDIAPLEMKPLDGRMWWSFYESDAHFENFIIRALAYVSKRSREDITKNTKPGEREDMLLSILDRQPYLLVLDGLERIMIAYARMDAARLSDDDYDKAAANWVAGVHGLPEGAGEQFVGQIQLRKTADPRAGNFLRKLAMVRTSRILVSTRLYPAELQSVTGYPIPGSFALFLTGLFDDDALALWRDLGVSGGRDELLRVFRRFDNYPLLIRALAGEVARFRRAPGDFDKWREHNPDFTPVLQNLRSEDTKSHVLAYALKDLGADRRAVLTTLAAFRAPAGYETLAALMVKGVTVSSKSDDDEMVEEISKIIRESADPVEAIRTKYADENLTDEQIQGVIKYVNDKLQQPNNERRIEAANRPFTSESELDSALDELEQRGLIGWDRRANRYDLHPIVRGVTWENVNEDDRRDVYESLRGHFESVPEVHEDNVNTLDNLIPTIELYQALIGLGRYDEAQEIFQSRLDRVSFYRLAAFRQQIEWLEMLFPDGIDRLPRLSAETKQARTLNDLALVLQNSGQPGRALSLHRLSKILDEERGDQIGVGVSLSNLSDVQLLTGELRQAEATARQALVISREQTHRHLEGFSLNWWGIVLAARGVLKDAENAQSRALQIDAEQFNSTGMSMDNSYLTQVMLLGSNFTVARDFANYAWELAHVQRNEHDFIRAARLQGEAALGLGDFDTASERLHHALTRARAVNMAEEELPALVALAEVARRQDKLDEARRLLDDVWEAAERGPYPLFHADALNVLAQIERDAGNVAQAVEAARKAYEKAWCDGPPFAYHWGLEKAKAHLDALGAEYPDMPPFDESKYEPMPEVEIDPPGEAEE